MRSIGGIHWTESSLEHVARHGVAPAEVEEVCFNEDDAPFIRTGRDKLHYVFGRTQGGRHLFIVVRSERRGRVIVVTARDMTDWERRYFKRRGK